MIKLATILGEGVTLSDKGTLQINVVKSSDQETDPFVVNRDKKSIKVHGIPTYFAVSPNPDSEIEDVTDIYDTTKDANTLDEEDLKKLVLLTAPSEPIQYVVGLPSTSNLNAKLIEAIKQKYKIPDEKVITSVSKLKYAIDDMVDQEKYAKADPTTQRMTRTWTRGLKKKYGDTAELPIKKSGNKETGHPGLQSGARRLLKPAYQIAGDVPKIGKILVVDDFLISGSSLREIYDILLEKGVPKQNIIGFCLGTKKADSDIISKNKKMAESNLEEKKGTCCGKCGHVHVKGTPCPKPYFTGAKHCSRRTDEMYKTKNHGHDDHHQVHSTIDKIDETEHFCEACLAEYITEHWDTIVEAEYRGRKVRLGKPFLTPGGPKKRSVYVKNAKGNVVKVNFGDPNLKIKKNIPGRRKSFRARHKCDNPGPRWKARYWSCKAW